MRGVSAKPAVADTDYLPRLPRFRRWQGLVNSLLDLLFPPRCVGCGKSGFVLCETCYASVTPVPTPICSRCGRPISQPGLCHLCRQTESALDGIRSVVLFEGVLRKAIHALKYHHRSTVAEPLGGLLLDYWQQTPLPTDVIMPVPLHPTRQRERGYNQAELLARALSRGTGLPLVTNCLYRQRRTAPQVTLKAKERQENVLGAFACRMSDTANYRVLLIDDVCTTGATLEACASTLRAAGAASSVWALTLARAR